MNRELSIYNLTDLPRYLILVGPKGIGKKWLAEDLCKRFGMRHIYIGITVDEVRQLTEGASALTEPTMYIIPDCDNMRPQAKNAILKTTEEPNNNVYICMTVESKEKTLATLLSRSYTYQVQPWTPAELKELFPNENEVLDIATNPLEVKQLSDIYNELLDFCDSVVMNIDSVSTANSLKIANRLSFKEGSDGYDPIIFLRVLKQVIVNYMTQTDDPQSIKEYFAILQQVEKSLGLLQNPYYNKRNTIDLFILQTREELRGCY